MEIIRIISNNFWKAGERFSLYIRKHFGRDEEKIKLLTSDGMLIKRPILVSDKGIFTGFKEDNWKQLL